MALRNTLLLQPETLQSFVLAAEERYVDAQQLLVRGRTTATVYLAGYVAEMLLKAAALRLRGASPETSVPAMLGPAQTWARERRLSGGDDAVQERFDDGGGVLLGAHAGAGEGAGVRVDIELEVEGEAPSVD